MSKQPNLPIVLLGRLKAVLALACASGHPGAAEELLLGALTQSYEEGYEVGHAVGSGLIELPVEGDVKEEGDADEGETTMVRSSGVVRSAAATNPYDIEIGIIVKRVSA